MSDDSDYKYTMILLYVRMVPKLASLQRENIGGALTHALVIQIQHVHVHTCSIYVYEIREQDNTSKEDSDQKEHLN